MVLTKYIYTHYESGQKGWHIAEHKCGSQVAWLTRNKTITPGHGTDAIVQKLSRVLG